MQVDHFNCQSKHGAVVFNIGERSSKALFFAWYELRAGHRLYEVVVESAKDLADLG